MKSGRYPVYRRKGWPIGSGVTESAVKLFNKRVKGTEQFWSIPGVESILSLRALWLTRGYLRHTEHEVGSGQRKRILIRCSETPNRILGKDTSGNREKDHVITQSVSAGNVHYRVFSRKKHAGTHSQLTPGFSQT